MTRASFPEIPQDALKSAVQPAQVERVWRRLELDVAGAGRARRSWYWLAPIAAASLFAAGVLVGSRAHAPSAEVVAVAEPSAALPATGAGPAIEPVVPSAEPAQPPAQKPSRARHSRASGAIAAEPLVGDYGEPTSALANEPLSAVEVAEWERLAEAGDFRAAKLALDRTGGFGRAAARASAGQLLVLADIARAAGDREHAAQALRRVLASYVSAPEAPLAAWTLGNLLEQAGDRPGAADAYATYRRLSPTGDFAEDAAARQVDAALSQGNLELGRRAMEEYAENFPKGRRIAELRKRLAALEAPVDSAHADATGAGPTPSEPDDDDDSAEPAAGAPAAPPAAAAREH
ncbi:MAG TPA: tetratricopeptide repeat protein [Polyangiaceae bacterium]|nr:tetratricopeptide repeat protein [Polyangiaceae bacterium]